MTALAGPYLAMFRARLLVALRTRSAAFAGFVTQCWWGAINVMVYAAFYRAHTNAPAALSLHQTIAYVWLQQGILALQPWGCDPEVADAVRTGAISHDRLRPVDSFAWWASRTVARIVGRLIPRFGLMLLFAGLLLDLAGLGAWSLPPPPGPAAGLLFALSLLLAVLLSATIVMLLNVVAVATLSPLGANAFVTPLALLLSGNVLPLALFPDWLHTLFLLQPFAGLGDIPSRLYVGALQGRSACLGLAVQAIWIALLATLGRYGLERCMARLEVQGG